MHPSWSWQAQVSTFHLVSLAVRENKSFEVILCSRLRDWLTEPEVASVGRKSVLARSGLMKWKGCWSSWSSSSLCVLTNVIVSSNGGWSLPDSSTSVTKYFITGKPEAPRPSDTWPFFYWRFLYGGHTNTYFQLLHPIISILLSSVPQHTFSDRHLVLERLWIRYHLLLYSFCPAGERTNNTKQYTNTHSHRGQSKPWSKRPLVSVFQWRLYSDIPFAIHGECMENVFGIIKTLTESAGRLGKKHVHHTLAPL